MSTNDWFVIASNSISIAAAVFAGWCLGVGERRARNRQQAREAISGVAALVAALSAASPLSVAKITLLPGDVLFIKPRIPLPLPQSMAMTSYLGAMVPAGVRVVVADPDLALCHLRARQE